MADGRHFQKPLNRHISATVQPILMNLHDDALTPPNVKLKFLTIENPIQQKIIKKLVLLSITLTFRQKLLLLFVVRCR